MDSGFNGIPDLFRENAADIGKCIGSFDTGAHISKFDTFLMRTVIFEKLYRNFSVSGFPGSTFQLSLECDSSKNAFLRKIRRIYCNDDGTVGITAVTCLVTHPIYCQHAFLRRSIYHIATGTHAKRINATSVFQCMGNFVAGCAQVIIFRLSVKILVDHGLGMFHAYSYCKRLWLHGKIVLVQHGKSISGTVAGSKNADFCRYFFFFIDDDSRKFLVTDHQISHCGTESEFPAHFFNLMAHKLNDSHKLIRTKVGFLLVKDFRWSSCFYKSGKDFFSSSVGIFYQSIQLSVGKSSRTAFSELHIGIRIQDAVLPEIFYSFLAFICFFSTFQYQWTVSGFCQIPGAE